MSNSYYDQFYKDIEKTVGKTVKSTAIIKDDHEVDYASFVFTDGSQLKIVPSEWIAEITYVEP